MTITLLDLFIDKLYYHLKEKKIGFKEQKYGNGSDFNICDVEESIDFDKQFLTEHIRDYFFNLRRKEKEILPIIFKDILKENGQLLYKNLSSLPILDSYRKGLDNSFPSLVLIFEIEDLANYLGNYKDKPFVCTNYYCFTKLLEEINKHFKSHKNYESIILHNFKIHSKLIRRTNGNIIATRSWCLSNISNLDPFEEFIKLDNKDNLFTSLELEVLPIFINFKSLQANFLLEKAKGIEKYKEMLKSLTHILNYEHVKKLLDIEHVEGNFVLDNKQFQLTFFSQKKLNCDTIEKNVTFLIQSICDYFNKVEKEALDFENQIFKVFQFHTLNQKLTPLGKEKEKVTKI